MLNQGDQGENLIPPSLILIPDIPDIPDIPNTGVPGVPWVPRASGACQMPSGQGPKTTYPRVSAGTAAAGQGYRGRDSVARLPQDLPRSVDGQPEVAGQRCNLKSNINLRLVQRCQVAIKDCVVVRWCPAMLHFMSLCQNTRHYCHTGCIMNARVIV